MLNILKAFYERFEKYISPVALISGFTFDYFTLKRVDFLFDNLLIIFYLIFAGASIVLINLFETNRGRNKFVENIYEFLPLFVQFSFGGLFSAFVIFYSKSASLFTSGAFILILAIFLIGNEFFKKRYSKLVFQVGVYFVAISSFSIYFLPVLIKKMGAPIFLLSGVISLILISIFIFIINRLIPERQDERGKLSGLVVLGLYISINILYFTNVIPPIPLSLKTADVFHNVERQVDGNYLVFGEYSNVWREKFSLSQKIHLISGEPVYVFSSIFAPTDLRIGLVHNWQYFDEDKGEWISAGKITFPIKGGRSEGYRGFSKKENVFEGEWRVDIETERGQVIGRVRFDIYIGGATQELESKII